jgi:hypothetical protein
MNSTRGLHRLVIVAIRRRPARTNRPRQPSSAHPRARRQQLQRRRHQAIQPGNRQRDPLIDTAAWTLKGLNLPANNVALIHATTSIALASQSCELRPEVVGDPRCQTSKEPLADAVERAIALAVDRRRLHGMAVDVPEADLPRRACLNAVAAVRV